MIGFSSDDLLHVENLYAEAEATFGRKMDALSYNSEHSRSALKSQIDAYFKFLASVAELARSKWTEFNLTLMGIGLGMMLLSLLVHILAIKMVNELHNGSFNPSGNSGISFGLIFAFFIVVIRACSLLSNSYICKFRIPKYLYFMLAYQLLLLTLPIFFSSLLEPFCQWKKGKWQIFFWRRLELLSSDIRS